MSLPDISIQISASAVAWYAAIVATIGVIMTCYSAWRDRPRVVVTINPNMLVRNAPPYDPNKTYIDITVRNRGRRPVQISTVSLKLYRTRGFVLVSDSIFQHVHRVLTEERPRTNFFIEQDLIDPKNIDYAIVYDETGKFYVKYHRRGARLRRFVNRRLWKIDNRDPPQPKHHPPRIKFSAHPCALVSVPQIRRYMAGNGFLRAAHETATCRSHRSPTGSPDAIG
jgi:hypothetical protein